MHVTMCFSSLTIFTRFRCQAYANENEDNITDSTHQPRAVHLLLRDANINIQKIGRLQKKKIGVFQSYMQLQWHKTCQK